VAANKKPGFCCWGKETGFLLWVSGVICGSEKETRFLLLGQRNRVSAVGIRSYLWQRTRNPVSSHASPLQRGFFYFSVMYGEIIETYPNNYPYPRCLIYGDTFSHEPVHSVWDYDVETKTATLVTVYRPDSQRWFNYKKRRY